MLCLAESRRRLMRGICRIVKNGDVTGVLVADDRDEKCVMSVEEYVDQDIQPLTAVLPVCDDA